MIVKELTKFHKVINIILNILIMLFGISSILLLIGYWFFRNTELFHKSSFRLFTTSLTILLITLVVAIIRDNGKRKLNLNINKNTVLEINSKEKIEKIKKYATIRYSGNFIITENKKTEVNNKAVFRIMQLETIDKTIIVNNKTKLLEMEPTNLLENIIGFMRFGISWIN